MDELVLGQDYWVNTSLGRPVRGLLVETPAQPTPITLPEPTPLAVEPGIEAMTLDVVDVAVQPP